MRKEFKLNVDQQARLMRADTTTPLIKIVFPFLAPPSVGTQRIWEQLGDELGFVWQTVRPIPKKGCEYFTAGVKQ